MSHTKIRKNHGLRGFKKLNGITVHKVETTCINEVVIESSIGVKYTITAELSDIGIPVISLTKLVDV